MEYPITTEDIEALVTKWYFQKKQKVPEEDKKWLRAYKEQEGAVEKELWKESLADVLESERTEVGPKETLLLQTHRGSQPAYGTKEFWKDWWARKKEKERVAAERAAMGFPAEPEPVKKKRTKKAIVIEPAIDALTEQLDNLILQEHPPVAIVKKVKLVRKKVVVVEP